MFINSFIILLLCQLLGELIVAGLGLPLPGTIVGMLILLLALIIWHPMRNLAAPAANVLINNLTLLFFPIGAGLILEWHRFSQHSVALVASLVIGTLLTIPAVALTLQRLLRK